jgi:hypothetical protein
MELDFTPVSTDPRSPAQRITFALNLVGAVLRGINCIPRRVRDEEASASQRLAEAVETVAADILASPVTSREPDGSEWPGVVNSWLKLLGRQFLTHQWSGVNPPPRLGSPSSSTVTHGSPSVGWRAKWREATRFWWVQRLVHENERDVAERTARRKLEGWRRTLLLKVGEVTTCRYLEVRNYACTVIQPVLRKHHRDANIVLVEECTLPALEAAVERTEALRTLSGEEAKVAENEVSSRILGTCRLLLDRGHLLAVFWRFGVGHEERQRRFLNAVLGALRAVTTVRAGVDLHPQVLPALMEVLLRWVELRKRRWTPLDVVEWVMPFVRDSGGSWRAQCAACVVLLVLQETYGDLNYPPEFRAWIFSNLKSAAAQPSTTLATTVMGRLALHGELPIPEPGDVSGEETFIDWAKALARVNHPSLQDGPSGHQDLCLVLVRKLTKPRKRWPVTWARGTSAVLSLRNVLGATHVCRAVLTKHGAGRLLDLLEPAFEWMNSQEKGEREPRVAFVELVCSSWRALRGRSESDAQELWSRLLPRVRAALAKASLEEVADWMDCMRLAMEGEAQGSPPVDRMFRFALGVDSPEQPLTLAFPGIESRDASSLEPLKLLKLTMAAMQEPAVHRSAELRAELSPALRPYVAHPYKQIREAVAKLLSWVIKREGVDAEVARWFKIT